MSTARIWRWAALLLLAGCASAPVRPPSPRTDSHPRAPMRPRPTVKKGPTATTSPKPTKAPPVSAPTPPAAKETSPEQLLAEGLSALRAGKLELASDRFGEILVRPDLPKPMRLSAELDAGIVASRQGALDRASTHFQMALTLDPSNLEAALAVADLHRREKQLARAEAAVRKLLSGAGDKARVWEELALIYADEGKASLAERVNGTARKLTPKDPSLWVDLAVIELGTGDRDAAIGHLQHALSLDPKCAAAYFDLGAIALRHRDAAGAVRALGKALALEPGNAAIRKAYDFASAEVTQAGGEQP